VIGAYEGLLVQVIGRCPFMSEVFENLLRVLANMIFDHTDCLSKYCYFWFGVVFSFSEIVACSRCSFSGLPAPSWVHLDLTASHQVGVK